MRKLSLWITIFACGILISPEARTASFSVSPIEMALTSRTTSGLLTIRNTSQREIRFEVTASVWNQNTRGEMQLTPVANQITFVPKLVTIRAGQSSNVRVGTTAAQFGAIERTYRIFVEELPDNSAAPENGMVVLRTKFGVPVFLRPARVTNTAAVDAVSLDAGRLTTSIKNTGTVHMSVRSVKMRGVDGSGGTKFERSMPGWYVLAGGNQVFEQPLSPTDCAGARTIAVSVELEGGTLSRDLPVPGGACR